MYEEMRYSSSMRVWEAPQAEDFDSLPEFYFFFFFISALRANVPGRCLSNKLFFFIAIRYLFSLFSK